MSKETQRLLLLALALGLFYGFIEAGEVMLFSLIPGALSWRTGNSPQILWVAPMFYGAAFTGLGLIVAAFAAVTSRVSLERVLVFVLLLLGAFLATSLQGQIVSDIAAAILALGIATEGTRQYGRRREQISRILFRSVPILSVAVLVAAIVTIGGRAAVEALRMKRLQDVPANAPNVLLLVMDAQRADHLSLYGYHRRTSPRLDSLGRSAIVFDKGVANSSWTLPTHATLFTGRLPFEHRAGMMRRPYLDGTFPTVAEVLQARGYATAGFVANTFWTGRQTRLNRGFIHYEDFYGNAGDAVARTALGRRLAYGFFPRFGFVDVPGRKHAREMNRDVLAWLGRAGDRPFFVFVNYFDVHGPLLPPAPFAGEYSGVPATARRASKIEIGAITDEIHVPPPDSIRLMVDLYDESIRYLDSQIGALLDSLKNRGVLDRTLVIVTSDHGESWGEHGMMFHGHSLYRDQTDAPLIVKLPGSREAGGHRTDAVGVDQIPATIAYFTGLPPRQFPGVSLFDTSSIRAAKESEVVTQVGRRSLVPGTWATSRTSLSALVTGQWHYIEPDNGPIELYDVVADPAEVHDLSGDTAQQQTIARLRAELRLRNKGKSTATRR